MTDTTKDILSRLADKPGATATEIGTTPVEMIRMEKAGYVTRTGVRRTPGKRGRPPVEWMVTGTQPPEPKVAASDENVTGIYFNREQQRMIDYIDNQLGRIARGERKDEDGGDERLLRDRRKAVIREAKRVN
jgi:hypothetical protein